jgi:heat shock protein HtpX
MKTLYTHQSENISKTWLLMLGFLGGIIGLGYFISQVYGNPTILYGFIGFSLIMNFVSFWFADKIALSSAHAIPADENQYRELHRIVENLAITAGLPKPRVYIINDPAMNAFATGRNKNNAAVAFTTGILQALDRSELEGVAAHELSHIGNRDILISTIAVVLVGFVSIVTDFFTRSMMFGGGRDEEGGNRGLLIIIGIALSILAPLVATIMQLAISRKRELLADASGALLTRYPDGLASALKKISAQGRPMQHASNATAHLFISNPFGKQLGFVQKLFMTHPPIEQRLEALEGLEQEMKKSENSNT